MNSKGKRRFTTELKTMLRKRFHLLLKQRFKETPHSKWTHHPPAKIPLNLTAYT